MEPQLWSNWIAAIGVLVNGALTFSIIKISIQTAGANKRSAIAAEASAESARQTYEISQKTLDNQILKEQKARLYYRIMYVKRILVYVNACWDALMKGYTIEFYGSKRDMSPLKNVNTIPEFKIEDLIPYFEYDEIEQLFDASDHLSNFKERFVKKFGNAEYEGQEAEIQASSLLLKYGDLKRHFSEI